MVDAHETPQRNNLITPAGYKKLVDEHFSLTHKERPKIVEEVAFAAKQGDRSENAEYQYGKKKLREIDSRLRFLMRKIDTARIIDPLDQRKDMVLFGAIVTIEAEDGKMKQIQIVGEDEIDLKLGKISWKSPLGKALLKAKKDDWVTVEAPAGEVCYQVKLFTYEY